MSEIAAEEADWKKAWEAAYVAANSKPSPRISEWSKGWYYITERGRILSFKPTLYRRKQIEEMTQRLLEKK
jgi:hypothetical protein